MSVVLVPGSGKWYRLELDGQWCFGVTIDWDIPGKYYITVFTPAGKGWVQVGPLFEDLQEAKAYAATLVRFGQTVV